MALLHSKEARGDIYEILKGGHPDEVIPQAAMLVNSKMEEGIRGRGQKPDAEALVLGAQYLVSDLIEIGNTGGFFEVTEEGQIATILQNTIQQYIQKGLKDGTVDPVELQKMVEPMLNEGATKIGQEVTEKHGLPGEPTQEMAIDRYAGDKVKEAEGRAAKQVAQERGAQPQGQLQGVQ